MATIPVAKTSGQDPDLSYLWETLTEVNLDGAGIEIPGLSDRSVQATGTFGGTSIAMQGSNDGAIWAPLLDPQGNAVIFTAAGIKQIQELTQFVRPLLTGGAAVDVDVTLYALAGIARDESRAALHTLMSGEHLILPAVDEQATPTLAFGDGDTGFYQGTDDVIRVATAGTRRWEWNSTWFWAVIAGPGLQAVAASATVPSIVPNRNDANTGIGQSAVDNLSVIAGGLEALRAEDPADLAATETSLWLYDLDNAAIQQVTVGAADSGGAGFKVLRIPN